MTEQSDRLDRLERAVFAAKDDWRVAPATQGNSRWLASSSQQPTGHDSLQAQLDELFALYGDLKYALIQSPDVAPQTDTVLVKKDDLLTLMNLWEDLAGAEHIHDNLATEDHQAIKRLSEALDAPSSDPPSPGEPT